jgi:tetratricopeptide (TPR) repeat protein
MEFYDILKDTLVHRTRLPKWAISVLIEVITLPLVAFAGFSELLEHVFHLESPSAQLIPACLTLALYWLVLIHYLSTRPGWIMGALAALLAMVCLATFKLWILYHTGPMTNTVWVPFLVVLAASFMMFLVANDQLTPRGQRGNAPLTERIAAAVGLTLFAAAFVAAILLPEEWYFILDTIFAEEVPEDSVGVLLAPYNRDPDDDARSRLQGDLEGLLGHDPLLAKEVKLVLLPRPIPGFEGGRGRDKQREIAEQIALYDGARILVYGAVEGKYQGYLVRTSLVLIQPTQFLHDALSIPQLIERPVTNDAASVHYFAAMIATASSFFAGRCTTAEQLADEAALALRSIPRDNPGFEEMHGMGAVNLIKATTIACQVAEKVASTHTVSEALTLLDSVLNDPTTPTDQRLAAVSTKGLIQRNVATERSESAGKRQELLLAIETYSSGLEHIPQDADPLFVAGVWNGLGVAREKLQETVDRSDKAAQLAVLASALEAYDTAERLIAKAAGSKTGASPADLEHLRAIILCNRANAVFKRGVVENDPDRIAEAIQIEQSQLPTLDQESWIHADLAGGFFLLSTYRDRASNLRKAREHLERGLALLGEESGPEVATHLVVALARANLDLARTGVEPSAEAQGIAALSCALRLSRSAGRDTKELEAALEAEKQRIGAVAFAAAQESAPPGIEACRKN